MLVFSLLKNTKNSSVAMAMQRFFEFFRRKNYGALWNNLFNFFHLRSSAMRIKFSQTYKKITSSFGVDYFLPLPLLKNNI